jgi:hypothetical protein
MGVTCSDRIGDGREGPATGNDEADIRQKAHSVDASGTVRLVKLEDMGSDVGKKVESGWE